MTELTQDRLKEVLSYDPDTGIFTNLTQRGSSAVGTTAGWRHDGYIRIKIDYKDYMAHRLVWLYIYGELPEEFLDHINEIRDDNRIVNLRMATHQENQHNRSSPKSNGTSGYLGVSWRKDCKKWQAQIRLNGRDKYLGHFNTAEQASEAYLKAKRDLHTFWEEKVT
jgi:hypothetical protein